MNYIVKILYRNVFPCEILGKILGAISGYYVNSTFEDFRASNDSRDLLPPVMYSLMPYSSASARSS